MTQFERPHVETVVHRLAGDPKRLVVAVTGPRQTGKTTIIRQALRLAGLPYEYVACDQPDDPGARRPQRPSLEWLVGRWKHARREAEKTDGGFVLAVDEVQHLEGWSGVMKGLWDQDQATGCPVRVIVSGSAPWSMLIGLHESMMGRFLPVQVSHWSPKEMADAFDFSIDEHLFFGGYPGAAGYRSKVQHWRNYILNAIVAPTIERDIVALTRVDKPSLMRRLMDLASRYSGQPLSYVKMLGQLQDAGNTTTLAHYLDLLSNAGLVMKLDNYSANRIKASSPKLNVLNTAVMTAPAGYTFDEARADRSFWGRIVESAVGAHLHNSRSVGTELHYWRHRNREVDFVLSRGPNVLGIEVKSGLRRASPASLDDFQKRFPGARTLLVGPGGVPLNEFLSDPASYWLDEYSP